MMVQSALKATTAWSFGWEALVAIATLVLAAVTVVLATATWRMATQTGREVSQTAQQVEATQEQARIANDALNVANEQTLIAQRTLAAQIRPLLIDVPAERSTEEELPDSVAAEVSGYRGSIHAEVTGSGIVISLPIRNAGAGLAIIRGVGLLVGEPIPSPPVTIMPANLPPGERGRINFVVRNDHPAANAVHVAVESTRSFVIELGYSDLAGEQLTVTRFDLTYSPDSDPGWQVRQVHHLEPGTEVPFVGSAPTV